jgi:proteasome alpha subunit
MQGQAQQQAYDRGITIFSPDGRLYQVEYAREAVRRGSASIGVRATDGVVLLADKRRRSKLVEPESVEKIHKVDDHIGIASAGHVADARQLIDFARQQAQVNHLRYDEPVGIETLTKEVTDHIQQYTQLGGARPFGVSLLIGGVEDGVPRLFETDPSGTPYEWQAHAIGENQSTIRDYLEEHYDPDIDLEAAVELALKALADSDDSEISPSGVGLGIVDVETGQFIELTDEEIADYIEEFDLDVADDADDEDEESDADEE